MIVSDVADSLAQTRRALHAVGELVLAGPQYRASGTIRLRVVPGGFATVAAPDLAVEADHLVTPDGIHPLAGATCAELAGRAGVPAGVPNDLYRNGSGVRPDEPLAVDPKAARYLVDCLAIGDDALRRFAPGQEPVLWPEHFDVGISSNEINYGVSAGDAYLPQPYAYVGPWTPRIGSFWTAPFGATYPLDELTSAEAVAAFFTEGRANAAHDPVAG